MTNDIKKEKRSNHSREKKVPELLDKNTSDSNVYFDQYEIEFQSINSKPKKSKFQDFKLWFNDIVRLSIIPFLK